MCSFSKTGSSLLFSSHYPIFVISSLFVLRRGGETIAIGVVDKTLP